MPVFTDLEQRVSVPPFIQAEYEARLPACREIADRIFLVHVSGKAVAFESLVANTPCHLPTSADVDYCSDDTRRAEKLLSLPCSVYFYAGRACPGFGNVALAFPADCESRHTGSATPFDTGGLVHPNLYIRVRLELDDGETARINYAGDSELTLDEWRAVFARVLAAYFDHPVHYWQEKPCRPDPEGLYELNDSWRAWTFEVRFAEPQPIAERVAWCSDGAAMDALRRRLDEQEVGPPGDPATPLEEFLQGPVALSPRGTADFCEVVENWIREQVGL